MKECIAYAWIGWQELQEPLCIWALWDFKDSEGSTTFAKKKEGITTGKPLFA